MKRVALLRHAKSDWGDPELEDFDRPLNERGWKAARRMGRALERRGCRFDLVLASPAARVRETIDGVQENFDFAAPIQFDQRMYLASEGLLLGLVRDLAESVQAPLLVGHNPGLQRLILALTHDGPHHLRDKVSHKFPTAALAIFELPAERWSEVEPGSGELTDLITPKDLD